MKLNLIVENKTYEDGIMAEHGLALLIETGEKTILFDSGKSHALINNGNRMNLDLSKVDFAVLSHGHYDHSGGFPDFNRINPNAPIYIHQNAFKEIYEMNEFGKPIGHNLGIQWDDKEKETIKENLIFTNEPLYITENIVISGSIPNEMREHKTGRFLEKVGSEYKFDEMEHEQFLAINENEQLYIFTACSHTGVKPVVDYAKQLFPDMNIRLVFGGFHLYSSQIDLLLNAVDRITTMDVEYYMPVHCTGLKATFRMKELLGDRCVVLNAGDKLYF